MENFSPFADYLGFSAALFSKELKLEKEQEKAQCQRLRNTSVSSVDTDGSDDTCVSDSSFRFFLPNIPEIGRPILPQKPPTLQPENAQKQDASLDVSFEKHIFFDNDLDREEIMSSTSDVRSSLHRYDASFEMSSSTMGGMMERFVNDVVERKIRDSYQRPQRQMICVFCQRNGETIEYYSTHVLKDQRGKVICPVLRKYVCPKCGSTGDNAHTLRHCPESRNQSSIAETFKTPRTSCGFRKF